MYQNLNKRKKTNFFKALFIHDFYTKKFAAAFWAGCCVSKNYLKFEKMMESNFDWKMDDEACSGFSCSKFLQI